MAVSEEEFELLETRVDRLEILFGQFMSQTGQAMLRLDRTAERLERSIEEMKRSMEEMKQTAEADRQALRETMAEAERRAAEDRQALRESVAELKESQEALAAKWAAERAAETRDWNRRWGELANRLGTVVEDIVAPNLPRIAQEFFGFTLVEDIMVRRRVRSKQDSARQREFDVIVVGVTGEGERQVIINETKSSPRAEDVDRFLDTLAQLDEYLPEYQGLTVHPVFASLSLPEELVQYMTRRGVYAMAMGDETMVLLNYDAVAGRPPRRQP